MGTGQRCLVAPPPTPPPGPPPRGRLRGTKAVCVGPCPAVGPQKGPLCAADPDPRGAAAPGSPHTPRPGAAVGTSMGLPGGAECELWCPGTYGKETLLLHTPAVIPAVSPSPRCPHPYAIPTLCHIPVPIPMLTSSTGPIPAVSPAPPHVPTEHLVLARCHPGAQCQVGTHPPSQGPQGTGMALVAQQQFQGWGQTAEHRRRGAEGGGSLLKAAQGGAGWGEPGAMGVLWDKPLCSTLRGNTAPGDGRVWGGGGSPRGWGSPQGMGHSGGSSGSPRGGGSSGRSRGVRPHGTALSQEVSLCARAAEVSPKE